MYNNEYSSKDIGIYFMSMEQFSEGSESTQSLGLSSFHERRRCLEEEHQWLLKQIKRKLPKVLKSDREEASLRDPSERKTKTRFTKIHNLRLQN